LILVFDFEMNENGSAESRAEESVVGFTAQIFQLDGSWLTMGLPEILRNEIEFKHASDAGA
jgi:hypothetical protein